MKRLFLSTILTVLAVGMSFGLWVESRQIADLRVQVQTLTSREHKDSEHINSLNKAGKSLNKNQLLLNTRQQNLTEVVRLILKGLTGPETDDSSPSKQSYDSSSFRVRVIQ